MRKGKLLSSMVWGFMALLVIGSLAGCSPKGPKGPAVPTTSTTPPPSTGPAPTLELSVSPGTIEKGQSATLTWNANNAQTVVIEPLGTVTTSGSRTVAPTSSTTYNAKAMAANRPTAEKTVRLTVTDIRDGEGTGRRPGPGDEGLEG